MSHPTEYESAPFRGQWGGKIETGEQPRDALRRELEEELGIHAAIGDELVRVRHVYKSGGAVQLRFHVVWEYSGAIENRIFRDVRWVDPTELPNFDFLEADAGLVRDLAAGKVLEFYHVSGKNLTTEATEKTEGQKKS